MDKITSTQNSKIKEAIALFDRRDREKRQEFLIEGYRETLRAVEGNHPLQALFVCPEFFLGENEGTLIARIKQKNVPVYEVASNVFAKLSYRDRPDGIIAVGKQQHLSFDFFKKKPSFLLVLESIEKPGNLGTMLRSADAVGIDAVIVCDRTTDIHNPNVVRASVGTLFTVPVIEASSEETLKWLKSNHIQIVATTPHTTLNYTESDLKGPVAIVMGTEQLGLKPLWLDQADIQVKIPMQGIADSLNVATAATLVMYEVLRQRGSAHHA